MSEFRNGLRGTLACASYTLHLVNNNSNNDLPRVITTTSWLL